MAVDSAYRPKKSVSTASPGRRSTRTITPIREKRHDQAHREDKRPKSPKLIAMLLGRLTKGIVIPVKTTSIRIRLRPAPSVTGIIPHNRSRFDGNCSRGANANTDVRPTQSHQRQDPTDGSVSEHAYDTTPQYSATHHRVSNSPQSIQWHRRLHCYLD